MIERKYGNIFITINRIKTLENGLKFGFKHFLVNYPSMAKNLQKKLEEIYKGIILISDAGVFKEKTVNIEDYLIWANSFCKYVLLPDLYGNAKETYFQAIRCIRMGLVEKDKIVIVIQQNIPPPLILAGYKLALGNTLEKRSEKHKGFFSLKRDWNKTNEGLNKFQNLFFALGLGNYPALLTKQKIYGGDTNRFLFNLKNHKPLFEEVSK